MARAHVGISVPGWDTMILFHQGTIRGYLRRLVPAYQDLEAKNAVSDDLAKRWTQSSTRASNYVDAHPDYANRAEMEAGGLGIENELRLYFDEFRSLGYNVGPTPPLVAPPKPSEPPSWPQVFSVGGDLVKLVLLWLVLDKVK